MDTCHGIRWEQREKFGFSSDFIFRQIASESFEFNQIVKFDTEGFFVPEKFRIYDLTILIEKLNLHSVDKKDFERKGVATRRSRYLAISSDQFNGTFDKNIRIDRPLEALQRVVHQDTPEERGSWKRFLEVCLSFCLKRSEDRRANESVVE